MANYVAELVLRLNSLDPHKSEIHIDKFEEFVSAIQPIAALHGFYISRSDIRNLVELDLTEVSHGSKGTT